MSATLTTSWTMLSLALTLVLGFTNLSGVYSARTPYASGIWVGGSINQLSGAVQIAFDDSNGNFYLSLAFDTEVSSSVDGDSNLRLYISDDSTLTEPSPIDAATVKAMGMNVPVDSSGNGNLKFPLITFPGTHIPHKVFPETAATLFAYDSISNTWWGYARLTSVPAGHTAYNAYVNNEVSTANPPVKRGSKGYNTLQAALSGDQSGPLQLKPGQVLSGSGNSDLVISSDVIIESYGGKWDLKPVIDLEYRGTLFSVASGTSPHIQLRGIEVREGKSPLGGQSGHLEMRNIAITDFHSTCIKHSGPLTMNKKDESQEVGKSNLDQSWIMGCGYTSEDKTTRVEMGGGIHILPTTTPLSITQLYFWNNVAVNGGAMYIERDIVEGEISENIYDANIASNKGGAIYTDHNLHLHHEKSFNTNRAGGGGAGLYVGGSLTMTGTFQSPTRFSNVADDTKNLEGVNILCRGTNVNIMSAVFKRPSSYWVPDEETLASSSIKIEPIPSAAVELTLRRVDFMDVGKEQSTKPSIIDGPLVVMGTTITASLEGCSWIGTSGWYSSAAVFSSSASSSATAGSAGTITIKEDRFVTRLRGVIKQPVQSRFVGTTDQRTGNPLSIVGGLYLKGRFHLEMSGWETATSTVESELLCGSTHFHPIIKPSKLAFRLPFVAIEGCPNKQDASIVLVEDIDCKYSPDEGKDVCDLTSTA